MKTGSVSRRHFIGAIALAGAAASVTRVFAALPGQSVDLVHDTLNGLLAFVVPGTDSYSTQQGVLSTSPGGTDGGGIEALIATIDLSTPYIPQFSATIAALLNGLAQAVNPAGAGPFVSPFANLGFAQKAAVFQIMDATDAYKVLSGILPAFVAFFVYSEAGVFDPSTRKLTGKPLGWTISNYSGVADGRDEFRGYLREEG
jgi:hypothetical protein